MQPVHYAQWAKLVRQLDCSVWMNVEVVLLDFLELWIISANLARRTTISKMKALLFANLAKLEHQQKTREAQHARQVALSAPFAWEGRFFHVLSEHTEIKLVKVHAKHVQQAEGIMRVALPVCWIANLVVLEHILQSKE